MDVQVLTLDASLLDGPLLVVGLPNDRVVARGHSPDIGRVCVDIVLNAVVAVVEPGHVPLFKKDLLAHVARPLQV